MKTEMFLGMQPLAPKLKAYISSSPAGETLSTIVAYARLLVYPTILAVLKIGTVSPS